MTPERERLELDDGDFLDLDWYGRGGSDLVLLSHGLEGNSRRPYIFGMAKAMNAIGIDCLAWNYRGCSEEPNRLFRLYHNGTTDDLERVVEHGIASGYRRIILSGFSMGGNMSLLYLGQQGKDCPQQVKGAVLFSATVDLTGAAEQMSRPFNRPYMWHFLSLLKEKVQTKKKLFPECIDDRGYFRIHNFRQFDDRYTAPIHGFADAHDYWRKCSSAPFLPRIAVPTLIVNALDDPFLGSGCYPVSTGLVQVETPKYGGHVGFMIDGVNGRYWSEERAVAFVENVFC